MWYIRHTNKKVLESHFFTPQSVEVAFFLLRTTQNLQSYGLCGILDIEKDNRPQRWVAELVKKNPLRARQSQGAVFLCP